MTIGYTFKAEFWLPYKASNFFVHPFDVTTFVPIAPQGRRKREIREQNEFINEADNSSDRGYDSQQDEHFEKHTRRDVDVVESGEIDQTDQDESNADSDLLEEEEIYGRKASIFLRSSPNFATSRWTIYKRLAALAER